MIADEQPHGAWESREGLGEEPVGRLVLRWREHSSAIEDVWAGQIAADDGERGRGIERSHGFDHPPEGCLGIELEIARSGLPAPAGHDVRVRQMDESKVRLRAHGANSIVRHDGDDAGVRHGRSPGRASSRTGTR
jgi:hypothetical protein